MTRPLEIISEARGGFRLISTPAIPNCHGRHHGVGKGYRHNYDNVAEEFVSRTLHESLPAVLIAIDEENLIPQKVRFPESIANGGLVGQSQKPFNVSARIIVSAFSATIHCRTQYL